MTLPAALLLVAGLVAATTAAGWAWRARVGRARVASGETITPGVLGVSGNLGAAATLLLFSSDFCSSCHGTRRALDAVAARRSGVTRLEINLTNRPDVATRFHVLQTPTTLLLDADGVVRTRVGGAPRLPELTAALDAITGGNHVDA